MARKYRTIKVAADTYDAIHEAASNVMFCGTDRLPPQYRRFIRQPRLGIAGTVDVAVRALNQAAKAARKAKP